MSEYSNGLLKATDQLLYYCKNQVKKIARTKPEKNTPRQIHQGGKLRMLNHLIVKLESKRLQIIKRMKVLTAKELRIGNAYFDPFDGVEKFLSLEDMIYICNAQRITNLDLRFEPIPLTEEILIKFGFENWGKKKVNDYEEQTEYVLFNSIDGNESFKVVFIESNYGGVTTKEYVIRVGHETVYIHRCEFVHDIQNAYYMFAGNDISVPNN